MLKDLKLDLIRIDGGTQPREEIDSDYVAELQAAVDDLPPVDVFYDGTAFWLADGFHRYYAHKRAGKSSIKATVHSGEQRDAQWFSFSANQKHGKRREPGDVKRALLVILTDEQWAKIPQAKIAEHVGCSPAYVSITASSINKLIDGDRGSVEVTRGGRTYTMNTGNIGKASRQSEVEVVDTSTGEVVEEAEIVTTTTTAKPAKTYNRPNVDQSTYGAVTVVMAKQPKKSAAILMSRFDAEYIRELVAELQTLLEM